MTLFRMLFRVAACGAAIHLAACGTAGDRKAVYLEKGEAFLEQKNYEKARVEFRNAIQIDPRDARAHERAGFAAERLGELREAVSQYQAAVDIDAKLIEARAALARLFVVGGVPDRAMEILEPGLAAAPGNGALLTARAAAKARLQDAAGARADAEAAYQNAPSDPYTVSLLASLRKRDGESESALSVARAGVASLPSNVELRVVLADLLLADGQTKEGEAELRKAVELDPGNMQNRVILAQYYLSQKDLDSAEKIVRGAVEARPDDVRTKMALVDFLARYRGIAAGEAELTRWIQVEPENQDLRLGLGAFQSRQNKTAAAQATYRQIVKESGTRPAGLIARNRLAELALANGQDVAAAEQLIGEVLAENPRDADALIMRSNLAMGRGDAGLAIGDLRTVLRDQPDSVQVSRLLARAHLAQRESALAEQVLGNVVQTHPQDVEARMDFAQVLAQNGKKTQAHELVAAVASEVPDNVAVQKALFEVRMAQDDLQGAAAIAAALQKEHPQLALGYFLSAMAASKQGKTAEATGDLERALQIEPDAAEPLTALVRMDVAQRKPERAIARLEQVITARPDNFFARNLKGATLVTQKRYDDAIKTYEGVVERQPRLAVAYSNLAGAHLAKQDEAAAISALRRGIEGSGDPGRLVTELALLHERRGEIKDATALYEAALRKTPASELLVNNYAMLLVNHPADETALARAVELADRLKASQNAGFIDTRGWVYFKAGRHQDALPLLQTAVERAPESPVLRYHLAVAQQRSGQVVDARGNLERALQSGHPFEGMEDARAMLKTLQVTAS